MKFGFRKPSFKKSFAARTSLKRVVRHSLGIKAPRGWGWLTNPKKAAYNRAYNRTTFGLEDVFGSSHGRSTSRARSSQQASDAAGYVGCGVFGLGIVLFGMIASASSIGVAVGVMIALAVAVVALIRHVASQRRERARAEAATEALQLAEARRIREAGLSERFGADVAERLMQGHFWEGATYEMVWEALGPPEDEKELILKTKTKTTLYYRQISARRYALKIHLVDGVVVGWDG